MDQKNVGELTATPVDLDELPAGYYCSKNFVGSLIAVCLMAISLYLGYVLPVNLSLHYRSNSVADHQIGKQLERYQC